MTTLSMGYLSPAPRVSTRPGVGSPGPQTHVNAFLGAARELGWQVHPYVVGDCLARPSTQHFLAHSVGASWARRALGDLARRGMSSWYGRGAERHLRGVHLDVVYERLAAFQAFGQRFQRRGIPWILETNGLHWQEADKDRSSLAFGGWARRCEDRAYQTADLVVAVSEALADAVVRSSGISRERILVLPNGVDSRRFQAPEGGALATQEGPLRLVFVGTVLPWQSLDLLMQAMAELAHVPMQLTIIGDGPALPSLRDLAQRLALPVVFLGRRPHDDIPALLHQAEVGFAGHRSFSGGAMYASPLKLYEYAAAGLPLLASDHPDARALCQGVGGGYLFRDGDVHHLRERLMDIAHRRHHLREEGRALARIVAEQHAWTSRLRTLEERLHQVIKPHAR